MTAPTTLPEALAEIEGLRGQVRDLLQLLGHEAKPSAAGVSASPEKTTAVYTFSEGLVPKPEGKEAGQHLLDLHQMIETVPDVIFKLDLQGNLVGWNKRLELVTGFTPQELNGRPALAFVPENEHAQTAAAIRRAFEEGYAELEGHLLTKTQLTIPYHWTGAALKNEEGLVIGITGVGRDVSDKRQTQLELQGQRQQLLSAQTLAHVGSWEWKIASGDMEWSEEQFRIFGHEPGAISTSYEVFLAAVLPDDHDRVRAGITEALKGQEPLDFECRIVRPTGEIRSIHCRGEVSCDHVGRPSHVSGSTLDITDQRRAEAGVRQSEAHFRALIENSSDIITVLDPDGTIRFESPSFERLLGYTQHEIDGRIAFDFIHPDDLPMVLEKFQQVVQQPGESQTAEFRFRHKDGSWRNFEGIGRATVDAKGQLCVIANSRDISERKRSEEVLIRSHGLLASFVEHTPAAVAMLDKNLRYVAVSHRWLTDYRLGEQDLIGRHHYDVFPEIKNMKELQAIHQRCLSGAVERCEEDRFIRLDGSEEWIRWEIRPWQDETGGIGGIIMFTEVITERKGAELARQESEQRFNYVVEATADGIWDWDIQTNVVYFSPQWIRLLGYGREDISPSPEFFFDILHPDDRSRVTEALQTHLEGRSPVKQLEVRLRQKSGEYRWYFDRGKVVIRDEDGHPLRMVGTITDITERKRTEMLLRSSEEKLRQALIASNTGLWDWNTDTNETRLSREWKKQLGYEEADLPDRFDTWESRLHPDDRLRAIAYVQNYLANPEREYRQEFRLRHKDGTYRWIEARASFITEPDGQRVRLLGSHTDITERKMVEAALHDIEARQRLLLKSTPAMIYSCKATGDFGATFISENVSLLGYRPQDFTDDPHFWVNHIHPDDRTRVIAGLATIFETGQHVHEYRFLRKEGTYCWLHDELRVMRNETGVPEELIGYQIDITDRKQAEEALRTSEERYARATAIGKVGVWELDVAKELYHADINLKSLFGYGPNELSTDPYVWLGLVHPDDQPIAWQAWERVVSGLTDEYHYELRMIRKDGTIIWTDVRGHAERDERGHVTRLFGATVDITERKVIQDTLVNKERELRTMLDALPIGVWFTDRQGQVLYGNPVGQQIWSGVVKVGLPDQHLGIHHWENIETTDLPHRWAIGSVLTKDQPVMNQMIEIETAHGSRKTIRNSAVQVRSDTGSIQGAIVLNEDVSERIQTERALHHNHELLSAIMDAATDIIFVKDLEGRYIHINEAGARTLGMSVEDVIGWNDYALWPSDLAASCQIADRRVLATGKTATVEEATTLDGKPTVFLTTKAPYRDPEGRVIGIIGVARDITKRKRVEATLALGNHILESVAEGLPLFGILDQLSRGIEIIAHDCLCSTLLMEPDGVHLRHGAAPSLPASYSAAIDGIAIGPSAGSCGTAAYENRLIVVEDIATDPLWADYRELALQHGLHACWSMPVTSSVGEMLGTFAVYYRTPRCPTNEDLQLIEQAARLAQIAIERYKASDRLRRMQFAMDHAMDAVYWIDQNAGILYVNEAATHMLGYPRIELLNMTVHDLNPDFPPDRWPGFWEETKQRGTMTFETTHRAKDGLMIPVEVQINFLAHEGGEFHCAFVRDITDRRRREEALLNIVKGVTSSIGSAFFQSLTKHLAAALGADHVLIGEVIGTMSDRVRTLAVFSDGQIAPNFEYDLFNTPCQNILALQTVSYPSQVQTRFPQFRLLADLSIEGYAGAPLKDSDGRVFGIMAVLYRQPIPDGHLAESMLQILATRAAAELERQQAEQALKASEERLRLSLLASNTGLWDWNTQTNEVWLSREWKKQIGYEDAELPNLFESWESRLHPEDHDRAIAYALQYRDHPAGAFRQEFRLRHKDETYRWIDVHASFVTEPDGQRVRLLGSHTDITERKQAEEALAQSERAIRELHEATAIAGLPFDEKVQRVLDVGCRRFNLPIGMLTRSQGHQLEILQVVAPGTDFKVGMTVPLEMTYCNTTLQETEPVCFDHAGASGWIDHPGYKMLGLESYIGTKLVGRNQLYGTICFAGQNPHLVPFSQADRDFIQLMARWISGEMDRLLAEQALRQSEERYRALYDDTPTMYFTLAADATVCSVNRYGAEQLGYRVEELVGHSVLNIFHEGDKETVATGLSESLAAPETTKHWEFRKVRKDGTVIWVRETARVGQSSIGEPIVLVTCEDITERKQVQEELRRSHAFLRQVIDTDPNFVFAKDRAGRFMLVNKALADAYGTTVDALIGKTDADFNPHPTEVEYFRQMDLVVMDTLQERFIPEEKITDSAGKVRWLQTVKRPILDETGRAVMVLGAATDITERKRMEEQLRRREHDLKQAVEERERISEDLHDGILQSIYAIGLGLEVCKPLISDQPKRSAAKLKAEIQRTIGQLNHVLEEVRNFIAGLGARIMDGQEFDVVLRAMATTLAASYSIPARILVDKVAAQHLSTEQAYHVMHVAREALSNSFRHSQARRITLSLKRLRRSVRLTVTDNGVGFSPSAVDGAGYGLSNMASRARKLGGNFTLLSKPRGGTKVVLDLPMRCTNAGT